MPKRKSLAPGQGPKSKRKKLKDEKLLAIKMAANTIIRPEYQRVITKWLEEKSIIGATIFNLGSQLFLYEVQKNFDLSNWIYFHEENNRTGEVVVRECFRKVLSQNKETIDEPFRAFVEQLDGENRFEWPKNKCMTNYFEFLHEQFATNVKTNLVTHCEKRTAEYLKYKAWEHNYENQGNANATVFDKKDIGHATNWACKKWDSTQGDEERKRKRRLLLDLLQDIGGPVDDNLKKYTKEHWFHSLPMWIYMQRSIDTYHLWVEQQRQQQPQNQPQPAPQQQPVLSKRERQRQRRAEQQPFQTVPFEHPPTIMHLSRRRRKRQRRIIIKRQKQRAANQRQVNRPQ
jgi:hypothetical protein